jgi:antitoxin VapB
MKRTAKIFKNGRSQAVRLPAECRFNCKEVYIQHDPETGNVILSRKPQGWEAFFKLVQETIIPDDFLSERLDLPPQKRDLF